jgi:ribosomal protein S18 acetylase RimI-like enzyme
MDALLIRPAARADLDAIGRMWGALVAYHETLDAALPHAAPMGEQRYAARIESHLDDRMACILVAQAGEAVVGYVLGVIVDLMPEMFAQEKSGFLADLFVEPGYRRRGIGARLLAGLNAWFCEHGIAYYDWHVSARNTAGIAFWEAMGGRPLMVRMRASTAPDAG